MNSVARLSFSSDPDLPLPSGTWAPVPWRAKWILAPGWDGLSPCVHAYLEEGELLDLSRDDALLGALILAAGLALFAALRVREGAAARRAA